jgi:hypothetical protein
MVYPFAIPVLVGLTLAVFTLATCREQPSNVSSADPAAGPGDPAATAASLNRQANSADGLPREKNFAGMVSNQLYFRKFLGYGQ